MGVAGLWDILKPAAKTRSLTELAIKEGFQANPDSRRGFRIGIDASIWFFHAEYGREGENPVLRTLFFRCANLMRTTFLPLFVFDGPKRPEMKRGKKITRTPHKLIPGMKQIVEAFGFEWRTAPGEAEAELAYLNSIGVIDGVLSDDVDNFLFGAVTVIRNASNTLSGNKAHPTLNSAGKDDKNHTRVFKIEDIQEHPDVCLTRGGMILIGLMRGGDYEPGGLSGCGVTTAHALAKCGFGDSLFEAALNLDRESLEDFIVSWRHELCQELRTNSKGFIGRKQVALANSITEDFPDLDTLLSYARPITSESMGRAHNNLKLTWNKEPDLSALAGVCEFYFEWGYKEAIIKRFRTVMWHSAVVRILRRGVLDEDEKRRVPTTPTRKGKALQNCGTPSRMIAKHFSSLALDSPKKVYVSGSEDEDDEDQENKLIVTIHSSRTHTSTDGLLEYRLEISPKQLVELTAAGIKGLRVPEGPDEWASEEDEDGKKTKGPVDPESHLRVWMPACMVELVEPDLVKAFEDKVVAKQEKKAKKGARVRAKAADDDIVGETAKPKTKATRKPKKAAAPAAEDKDKDDDDVFSSPVVPAAKKATKPAPKPKTAAAPLFDDDDLFSSPVVPKAKKATKSAAKSRNVAEPAVDDEFDDLFASPVVEKPKKATKSAKVVTVAGPSAHPPRRSAITVELGEDDGYDVDDVEKILRERAAMKRNPLPHPMLCSAEYEDDLIREPAAYGSAQPFFGASPMKAREEIIPSASPVLTRTGVKDLTKRKKPSQSSAPLDLKAYYSVSKATATMTQSKNVDSARPSYQSSQSSQSSVSSSQGTSSLSSSHTRVASSAESTSLPDFARKEKLVSSAAAMRCEFLDVSDHDDRPSGVSNTVPSFKLRGAGPPSPAKRKTVQRKIASSDSESSAHVHKSPRKKPAHASPKRPQRPAVQPGIAKYLMGEVIEISDSDNDDASPPQSLKENSSVNLPPLLAARTRAASSQPVSKPVAVTKQRKKVPPIMHVSTEDIIDLT
ncbi:hypothetical protein D9619_011818 [Psilocybe cf. subviscida]|uniref:XPG-I domain-containing protein n=1 Tax=Psilocybe cf. subviscida TaxID=2480587 RepID=A0A8H5B1P0_9AGAR|nr:hypothetical protein D9619_011818 [Psilocybe cf. subviscida]